MDTAQLIKGIHHVTATVGNAQADYDFYTRLLGFRLVKKTVNFDNNQVYHFYYGTADKNLPYSVAAGKSEFSMCRVSLV